MATTAAAATPITTHHLSKESELRLEVGDAGPAFLKLTSGSAEVFGVELAEGRTYMLAPGRKLAAYSWYGAELQAWGALVSSYVSDETAMVAYANLHQRLEVRREEALSSGRAGPHVLIAGPTDSGKSSLTRILGAYAARVGRCPLLVDLDVGQGEISIPGTLAAAPLDRAALSVESVGGLAGTSIAPLVFYFGHTSPSEYAEVYRNAMSKLADAVMRRGGQGQQQQLLPSSVRASGAAAVERASGMIVNTMGWIEGGGYSLLLDAVRLFAVDVVVVLGNDKLFARLVEDVKTIAKAPAGASGNTAAAAGASAASSANGPLSVAVVKLPKPGGAVERSGPARKESRRARIREYFYGPPPALSSAPPELSPVSLTLPFDAVVLVRVGGSSSEASILPIGKASTLDPLRTRITPPSPSLLNQIVGVSFATSEKQVPHANVAGFVHM